MGHSHSKIHTYQLSAGGLEKGIPPVIRVSHKRGRFLDSSYKLLLSGPNGEPMYTIDLVKGLYSDILLHSGSSIYSPLLAASSRPSTRRGDYLIRLPSLSGDAPREEILHCSTGLTRRGHFWFVTQVGHGPDQHREGFEWRSSRGAEVRSVGQSSRGYKLVRVGSTNFHNGSTNRVGYTSDGKEVVAVWANTSLFKSWSGVGEFQFRGSGATGELGQLWALMAVMSCMSIWQKVRRDAAGSHGASAGGAGGAGGAGAGACGAGC
ncbi:uncharacterized protein FSUBG_4967 [Fusarium subglutinans]|uniref:Uncharacterized protein n=1 Tax=Gibberella subglutinans TaxID=42677 RepID=A0A8H5V3W0_GIBSU|nr:uncharacterized protein FSUBG_4967 [Fusarium subglutinans]KAF5607865.1 hypothetical protein FSUBG_4967 [Fusarium subglutinans]